MKTVLITGCSSGFGLEIARYFLARDWQVVATMRTPRADVLPPSERLRVLPLDVTDTESIRKAVEAAGPIDVLVNNAGFGAASPAELIPLATVREIFETNTFGTIALTQAVLPQFRQRKAGVVVNVTSSVTLTALPLIAAYSASKAAVRSFARTWLVDLKERKIRVNILSPGTIDTPILDPLGPDAKEYFKTLVPRGEIGRPEEIATVALFLASSDSSFVNGIELFVDGGTAQI